MRTPASKVTTQWHEPESHAPFTTGVSLHSHTSFSEESLMFIHKMALALPFGQKIAAYWENRAKRNQGRTLDFERANWRPPLQPLMAYELEAKQITDLGCKQALVSISDHDTIEGTLVLRTLPVARHIPMSVEWSAPYGKTVFHLGIHNLPSANGAEWMKRLQEFTANPSDDGLIAMLHELHAVPQVLIVFNHPLWDLYSTGALHIAEMRRFIAAAGETIHALELNGLRHARENREVVRLAKETGHVLISGGDRHGLEPNANINLTNATSFTEFVHEIREDRVSHVHFMPQYRQPWEQRILESTLNAITNFPQFMPGWQRWDERCFHPDRDGTMRSFAEMWPNGRAPKTLLAGITAVRFITSIKGLSAPLSLAFQGVNDEAEGLGAELAS